MSILLPVIGEDAVKAFDTSVLNKGQKEDSIKDVLTKFDECCEARTQVIVRTLSFQYSRKQEAGDHSGRDFIRDRLVRGEKVRERLLRVNNLTLSKAIDICKAQSRPVSN